jgi:hypothetical protein
MIARKLALALAAGSFIASAAFAQAALVDVDDSVNIAPLAANADTVEDWDVFNSAGVKIGDVEDVVGTDANTPTGLVIDFDDGSDYTDRDVMIALDQLSRENDRLILTADAATVNAMAVWND